ncbi:MAG: CHASE2 domain-containing protein [Candidatus Auribacterota bacterium]
MKKSRIKNVYSFSFIVACLSVSLVLLLKHISPSFIEIVNLKILDNFFQQRGVQEFSEDVVIAAVDEKSIAALGRWPWSRSVLASLVERLNELGAAVIGFDMVFSEQESGLQSDVKELIFKQIEDEMKDQAIVRLLVGTALDTVLAEHDTDNVFARSLANESKVIIGHFFFVSPDEVRHLQRKATYQDDLRLLRNDRILRVFESDIAPDESIFFNPVGINVNIPEIVNAATGTGFFNTIPDADGAIRHMPLVCRFDGDFYPSLSLQIASEYLGDPIKLQLSQYGIEQLSIGQRIIPVSAGGKLLVNYIGPSMTFAHYSIADILKPGLETGVFRDKIVLVGITATGLYDLRVTPFSAVYPGVEIHASVIDNILNQKYITQPWWTYAISPFIIIAIGIVLSVLLPFMQPLRSCLFTILITLLVICGTYLLFLKLSVWYPPIYELLTIWFVFLGVTLTKFIMEERERRFIKNAFGQYLSAQFVNQLVSNPQLLKLGGEEKELTVLFTDIVGFTSISEQFDPTQLVTFLNGYTTQMSDLIMENSGTIDKYSGDAIMAFFGAPLFFETHAQSACYAALAMQRKLKEMRTETETSGIPYFATRIGINTGKMVVGNMGSDNKFNYTVIGDAVNLASRLEGTNKFYKTSIVIGEDTQRKLDDSFITRELDSVKVKGKTQPVRIFELIETKEFLTKEILSFLEIYRQGIKLIHERRWKQAADFFEQALKINPDDTAARLHLSRCQEYCVTPPDPDWDGAYELKSK